MVNERFAFTQDPKILESMARGTGPRQALFFLGYAGWAPGQLDAELATGSWGIATTDERLVFETAPAQKWIEAMAAVSWSSERYSDIRARPEHPSGIK